MPKQKTAEHEERRARRSELATRAGRMNRPAPKREAETDLSLVHWRVRSRDLQVARALAAERGIPFADLMRTLVEHGCQVEAALGPPDERGNYGGFTGERLAQLLRAEVNQLIDFLMQHGQTPAMIQLLLDQSRTGMPTLSGTAPTQQHRSLPMAHGGNASAVTHVDPDASATLSLFFAPGDTDSTLPS